MQSLVSLILVVWYIIGIVLAKGFWLTSLAMAFAPYSLYVVVEYLINN